MYKIFCCRSRKTSKVEVDEITDSLEKCLLVDRGVLDFNSFLIRKSLHAEKTTLAFALKCQSILTDLSKLSPHTRENQIPEKTQNDIENLYKMAEYINFDLDQMNTLSKLQSADVTTHDKSWCNEVAVMQIIPDRWSQSKFFFPRTNKNLMICIARANLGL